MTRFNAAMRGITNKEIRRRNFWALVHPSGYTDSGVKKCADLLNRTETRIRHLITKTPEQPGPKTIGDKTAEHIEKCYKKPTGWLDLPHPELWGIEFSEGMEADMENKGTQIADSTTDVYNVINQTEKVELRRVPVISKEQAAKWNGDPDSFDRESHKDWVHTEEDIASDTFAIRMIGDTMTADAGLSIPNGSILLVEPGVDPGDQQIVVANVNGEVVIKQLVQDAGNFYLKSLNTSYRPILIDSNTDIIGVASDLIFSQKLPK